MLKLKRISHVAVAVENLDHAVEKYRQVLGIEPSDRELVPAQKVETMMFPIGEASIELLEPKGNEGLAKFLEKRGPGLHHVAIEVEGIEDAIAFLKSLHVPLIDEAPRVGAHGHKAAFLHPRATGGVLVELVEPLSTSGAPGP